MDRVDFFLGFRNDTHQSVSTALYKIIILHMLGEAGQPASPRTFRLA
jgi:hypothetical protein